MSKAYPVLILMASLNSIYLYNKMESLLLVSLCSMSDSILETKIVTFINIYFNKNIVIGFVGEYNYLILTAPTLVFFVSDYFL